jgi:anti-anti-sigma factor
MSTSRSTLEITTRETPEARILELDGRLDSDGAGVAEAPLLALLDGRAIVLVDLAKVVFVGSAGLRVIIKAAKQMKAAGGILKFCGASAGVAKVFEISGLDSLLDLHDDATSALQSP